MNESPAAVIARHLADPATAWSLGTFGAIAEFQRDAAEPFDTLPGEAPGVVTARGAIRLATPPDLRLFAYETPSPQSDAWRQGVALLLPETACAMGRRRGLSPLGPDREALRRGAEGDALFDLGLGCLQVDVCVRSATPGLTRLLAEAEGREAAALLPALVEESPHRVFRARVGRIEVFQPIPPPDGVSPEGPHTHLLPSLLKLGRTHAATLPIPPGWVPCATLHPADPLRDATGRARPFDAAAHAAFQALLATFGEPGLLSLKRAAAAAVVAGERPERFLAPEGRAARATLRVALRQLARTRPELPLLPAWRRHFDRAEEERA